MERWRDTKRDWQAEFDELKPSFLKCTSYTSSCLIQSLAPSLKYRNVCFLKNPHISINSVGNQSVHHQIVRQSSAHCTEIYYRCDS